jgi:hypothetical protein
VPEEADVYLSYSGYKKNDSCSFAYWNSYINHTAVPPDDRLGSVYGSAIGTVFEHFYNKEWFRKKGSKAFMLDQVERIVAMILRDETSPKWGRPGGLLKWKGEGEGQNPKALYADRGELISDVRDSVVRGIEIVKHHKLIGTQADAEVKLDSTVNGHKLGGRADFVIKRISPHKDLVIVDGKGSKWRDKYIDPEQVKWYGMLYRRKFHRVPDRLGFLYWRCEPENSVDWVHFVEDDFDELLERVLTAIQEIEQRGTKAPSGTSPEVARKVFRAVADRPGSGDAEQACRFCSYATEALCPRGLEVKQSLAR